MTPEEKLDDLINQLKEVEAKLEFLLKHGSNNENLVDKKRELIKEIKSLKNSL